MPPADQTTDAALPLAGVRILELANVVAGPSIGAHLSDFGAEVIKVERPGEGDASRTMGEAVGDRTAWWLCIGRNKQTIALDLKQEADREAFLRLAAEADAVVESFRPGVMERLGLAPEQLHELTLDVGDPVQLLDHVDGDADRPRLVGDSPRHRLADPPGRVGRELVAAPVVELLNRADQPQAALLDQVEEAQPAPQIAFRDRDDEAQVGLDHLPLGEHVAALDPLREFDLLGSGQQLDLPDRAQVEAQAVEARFDREVELRLFRAAVGGCFACLLVGADAVFGDHFDPVLDEVRVQGRDLLLGDLDLLERRRDLLEGEVAALAAQHDQPPKLL
jgi:hypothetical protein